MKRDGSVDPSERAKAITAAIARGVRRAIQEHKRDGDPIVVCEDGMIRTVSAEDIVIPDEPPAEAGG
jgi:hypothetical protein